MKPGLLEEIRSRGHWRVNLRPQEIDALDSLTLRECLDQVQRADVSLRGWNYPHVPSRDDENTGVDRHGTFIEAWVDWMSHREFWRMYTSTQFVHYRAINEDWLEREHWGVSQRVVAAQRNGPTLGIVTNLWEIAEVCEFATRLHQQGKMYRSGVEMTIQVRQGTELEGQGRTLRADESGRFPLSASYQNMAAVVEFRKVLSPADLAEPKATALEAAQYIFDKFGWTPSRDVLTRDIEALYRL